MGYPKHNRCKSSSDRRKSPRPGDRLQHGSRLSDQGEDLAYARAEFYVLVGWYLGRKEASFPDARDCPGRVSTWGETSLKLWHWRADRGDTVSPVQPPLDRFDTLPVLRLRAGTVQGVSTPIRCSLRRPRVHLEMRVASKSLDRDKRAAKTISLTALCAAVFAPMPTIPAIA